MKKQETESKTRWTEVCLFVADFDDDFDVCREAFDKAEEITKAEMKETEGIEIEVTNIEFVEFDSSNPSHACGYFSVDFNVV